MKKILISAYGCEPFVGSEPGVGWQWILQLGQKNKLYVITRQNNKEKIEENLPEELKENVEFYYYDAPDCIKRLKKREKGLYFYYTVWQIGIIKLVKEIIKNNTIDYTMHLTFGSFWMPTFLPFFKVPFIWGPLGGGDCVPKSFLKILPMKERVMQHIRYFLKGTASINPFIVYPAKRAKVILVRTQDSTKVIPKRYLSKVKVILETAMTDDVFVDEVKQREEECVELLYTGRLISKKNVLSLIEAIKLVPEKYNIHLTIIGRGNEKSKLLSLSNKYNLANKITIIDELPREKVLEKLASSHIYLFPSLCEGGSWALMEAMAKGLPVICLDSSGMHTITTEDSAIRIKPTEPEAFVQAMADNIVKLYDDEQYRMSIGQKARDRIWSDFRWREKGLFMEKLFSELEK